MPRLELEEDVKNVAVLKYANTIKIKNIVKNVVEVRFVNTIK